MGRILDFSRLPKECRSRITARRARLSTKTTVAKEYDCFALRSLRFRSGSNPNQSCRLRVKAIARTRTIFEIFIFICSLLSVYLISGLK